MKQWSQDQIMKGLQELVPEIKYLENKYGIEYKEEVKKRLDSVIRKRRNEKQFSKKISLNDELKEKWR